jgi:hypothetical protein
MTSRMTRASKKAAAALIKLIMGIAMLVGLIGIPYWIITSTWDLLVWLFHEHAIWFFLLIAPIVFLAIKLWKWLYELLGASMMAVGGIVDRLE